jgi:hypothetical protein
MLSVSLSLDPTVTKPDAADVEGTQEREREEGERMWESVVVGSFEVSGRSPLAVCLQAEQPYRYDSREVEPRLHNF